MGPRAVTVVLLAVALILNALLPPRDEARAIAESLIGPVMPVETPGPPIFQADDHTVLFFQGRGMRGEISGVVVVEGDSIREIRLLSSRDGLRGVELNDTAFLDAFRGKKAQSPVVAQAVSGATISCQALIDAVNTRLSQWQKWRTREGKRP